MCIHSLWLRISGFHGRQRAVCRSCVVIESLLVSRAGDSSGFQAAFVFDWFCKAYQSCSLSADRSAWPRVRNQASIASLFSVCDNTNLHTK